MKYQAKQMKDGQYAVFTGSKYFTATVGDKAFAEQQALILSMQWYRQQADLCASELMKNFPVKSDSSFDTVTLLNRDGSEAHTCDIGDLLC
jgi:hypothetical protein